MRFYTDILEQMDLSLDHIAMSDPLYDRFAIMLIDNCMELFLHRYASDFSRKLDRWAFTGKQPPEDKVARLATGQNFNDKVKLAVRESILSQKIGDSVRLLHEYRNSSYHAGLKHSGILNSMARLYFRIVSEVLSVYRPSSWGYNPSDIPSVRVLKYVGCSKACHRSEFIGDVFSRLVDVIDSMGMNIKEDLSKSFESMIEECDWGINFIVTNAPTKDRLSRDLVVLDSEVWSVWCTDIANDLLKRSGLINPTVANSIDWLGENYSGLCRKDPIPGWNKRLASIQSAECHHDVLKKYCDFVKQTESIRDNVLRNVGALEEEIERQIDEARGK